MSEKITEYKCDSCMSEITTIQKVEGNPMLAIPCHICNSGNMVKQKNSTGLSDDPVIEWKRPSRSVRRKKTGYVRKHLDNKGLLPLYLKK